MAPDRINDLLAVISAIRAPGEKPIIPEERTLEQSASER
jgi:hypothetical protein